MVHYNHILKHKYVGVQPVQKWYQSHGSEPREKPTYRHDQGLHTGRYLLRETPRRLLQWNSRKKTLSPKGKEMLMKEVEENKAYNTSRVSAKPKDHGKKIASSQKEKRARCYICKERGHVFWTCQNRKNIAMVKVQKETVEAINKNDAEKVKYPEKVHVIADHMIEGTNDETWDRVWYVSSAYKYHMCPNRLLFKKLDYKFKMIGKEEVEKKFIFSYGIGDATVKGKDKDLVISNVQYTPEVSLNILSMDQLEEQGYIVKYNNNKCTLQYMFDEEMHGTGNSQRKGTKEEVIGPKDVISEHNRFLDDYFESIDPKDECSLVKGLEDLTWDRKDTQDYVDEEYISWNGSLYALKVNSFARFLSFMNLLKKDSLVYKNWEVFSKKYVEMLKWFYLVYLNYDRLEKMPPVIGVMEINLLSLHKIVDSLGGYLRVTLGDKWNTIAKLQGLTDGEEEAVKNCYRRFIDMVQTYYETAEKTWYEVKPEKEVVKGSGTASVKDPQGKSKVDAGMKETLDEEMNKTQFGVRLESNDEEEAEEASRKQ
ncbi:ARID DNA-binding domain-containing protein [Tanacetum coccineum]